MELNMNTHDLAVAGATRLIGNIAGKPRLILGAGDTRLTLNVRS